MDTLLVAIGLAVALGGFLFLRIGHGRGRAAWAAWALWVTGLVSVVVGVHFLKHWVGREEPWQQRPPGACRCDLWESSENNAGEHGFPSGHSAFALFYVLGLWWWTKSPWVLAIGLPWVAFVGYSRIHKRCHSVPQVVAGYIVGLLGFIGFVVALNHIV